MMVARLLFTLWLVMVSLPAWGGDGNNQAGRQAMPPSMVAVMLAGIGIGCYGLFTRRVESASARAALAENEANLRLILDSTDEGIYGIDLDGNCTFCNAACLRLLGFLRVEDLLGKNMHELIHHTREDGAVYPVGECRILRTVKEGQGETVDEVLWRADGSSFAAECRSYPQYRDGKAVGAVVSFIDVSEQKFKEKARLQTAELLQLASTYTDLRQCLASLSSLLQEWSRCEAVGIRLRHGDDFPYVESRGFPAEFIEVENKLCTYGPDGKILRDGEGNPILECMCGNVLCGRFDPSKPFFSLRGSFWSNSTSALLASTTEVDRQARTRNRCNGEGYESVALIPMRAGENIIGLIQFNDRTTDRFTPALIEAFEGVADKVALALTRRQAERQLQREEKLHRDLLNTIPDLVWLKDPDGVYLSCNTMFERFFGASERDITGKTDYDFVSGELADFFRQHDKMAIAAGVPSHNEEWVTFAADGHRALLYTTKTPMYDAEGKLIGILGVGRDITQLRQAEDALRESESRLRYALEGTNDGWWDEELQTGKLYLGPRACEILGYPEGEIAEVVKAWHDVVHPDDMPLTRDRLQAHLDGQLPLFEVEQRLRTRDGEWKSVYTRGKVVERAEDGTPLRFAGTFSDITEKKFSKRSCIKL